MLWYGFKHKKYSLNISDLKSKRNTFIKKYSWKKHSSFQFNKQNFRIYKPHNWDLLFLHNTSINVTNIVILSPNYYIKMPFPNLWQKLSFDANTSTLKLHTLYPNNSYRLFYTTLRNALKALYLPTILKIKFKGKGYYVYKNKRHTITPQFGYAHRLYLYSYFVSVKFLSKTSILLFGFSYQDLKLVGTGLKKMRPINIFTGRGVRFSKQIIYKKVGKVSSYR